MRLVFVLYAEERDLMPADALYEANYGLRGLFKKLRDDAARHGDDLMDRRYGAWARLLALFRLIVAETCFAINKLFGHVLGFSLIGFH